MSFSLVRHRGGTIFSPVSADGAVGAYADALAWSSPATWGGRKPGPNDVVQVPAGCTLLIDENIEVTVLEIQGTVLFAARDLQVKAIGILVSGDGVMRAGDARRAFAHRLVFTLGTGRNFNLIHGLGSKFLAAVNGGAIELFGPRRRAWARLSDSTTPGTILVRLSEPVDWSPGDKIIIASGGAERPLIEERGIFGVTTDGLRVTLDAPVSHRHEGQRARMRYGLTDSAAKVVLLSRSIAIEGDANGIHAGYGAHMLIAGRLPKESGNGVASGSRGCFVGVEFRRMGQFNRPGRYPAHWCDNQVARDSMLKDCVIHESFQRGVVVSGTRGVQLHGNVVYKPLGHGFVLERPEDWASILVDNLTVRPRPARFVDPAMRAMDEVRPRSVWFSDVPYQPPPVDTGDIDDPNEPAARSC